MRLASNCKKLSELISSNTVALMREKPELVDFASSFEFLVLSFEFLALKFSILSFCLEPGSISLKLKTKNLKFKIE